VFFKTEIIDKMPSSASWQLLNLLSVFSGEYLTSVYPCQRPDCEERKGSCLLISGIFPVKELCRVLFDSHKLEGQHKCWCLAGSSTEMELAVKHSRHLHHNSGSTLVYAVKGFLLMLWWTVGKTSWLTCTIADGVNHLWRQEAWE